MAMSAEQRAAQGERMRALHASGKMKHRNKAGQAKSYPNPNLSVVEGTAMSARVYPETVVDIRVDWQHVDIAQAQQLFAKLRGVLDSAGRIINARLSEPIHYPCEICRRMVTARDAKFMDSAYKDPETKLVRAAFCCSEECYSKYMRQQIEERRQLQQRR